MEGMDAGARWELLMKCFGDARLGGPKTELAKDAGVWQRQLYGQLAASVVQKVGVAAARRLSLPEDSLLRFLLDGEEALLGQLKALSGLRVCVACELPFPDQEIIAAQGRCYGCVRRRNLQQRLERSPKLAAYYSGVRAALPEATKIDPELCRAVAERLDGGRALKMTDLADELKTSRGRIVKRFKLAGLVAAIAGLLGDSGQFFSGENDNNQNSPHSPKGRRRGAQAAKLAARKRRKAKKGELVAPLPGPPAPVMKHACGPVGVGGGQIKIATYQAEGASL